MAYFAPEFIFTFHSYKQVIQLYLCNWRCVFVVVVCARHVQGIWRCVQGG